MFARSFDVLFVFAVLAGIDESVFAMLAFKLGHFFLADAA